MTALPRVDDDVFDLSRTAVVFVDGKPQVITERQPGDDDDIDDPDLVDDEPRVPLGTLLREYELDAREARLQAHGGAIRLEGQIRSQIGTLSRRTLAAVRAGKRAPSPEWELLGRMELARLHGGTEREWITVADRPQGGEWRSKYRKTCRHPGCRACGGPR